MILQESVLPRSSFSYYLDQKEFGLVEECALEADAVVLAGSQGPEYVRRLRANGWDGKAFFDRAMYKYPNREIDRLAWIAMQRDACAGRLLTQGRLVEWSEVPRYFETVVRDDLEFAIANGATALFALDHRWLTRGSSQIIDVLGTHDAPVALVLVNSNDPLSIGGAVSGLLAILRSHSNISILRCDHGAIGALAFGAVHGSIGLRTGTRHLYPPGSGGFGSGKPNDRSVRLFSRDLLDWFTAATIAGWSASEVPITCSLPCCGNQELARFLDERRIDEANFHNRTVIGALAGYILNAPSDMRRRLWAECCHQAIEYYDRLGSMHIKPKGQLKAWAMWF